MLNATQVISKPPPRFIADVHLGKLARLLRMAGLDVLYQNNFSKTALLHQAYEEKRMLLTGNASLTANPFIAVYHIAHSDAFVQWKEVIQHFNLAAQLQPFTRCMVCNTLLKTADKAVIENCLQEGTKRAFHQFWQCPQCRRIYWQGSHFERMQQMIESLVQNKL